MSAAAQATSGSNDYKVADISLAEWGRKEIEIAEENKQRQVLVALRNKERTDAVEVERVKRDQELESIERQRVTELKDIEKEKALEVQRKEIQDVIKERVAVEKTVVIEQEKIKDTEAFAGADRTKQVKVTLAEAQAQEILIEQIKRAEAVKEAAQLHADQELYERVKAAEADKQAAELHAEEVVVAAEAEQAAAEKQSAAKKMLAEATAKETAAPGIGEAEVMVAKADATEKQGTAEAKVNQLKFEAEATGIEQKAAAMKLFEEAGQDHEEFKLELEKEKAVELAEIDVQRQIAEQQAVVVGEALKSANIDIVGGETQFFDRITNAITTGKAVDRTVDNSRVLGDVKETFFNGDPEYYKEQIASWIDQYGIETEDIKNLSVGALLGNLITKADGDNRNKLLSFLNAAERFNLKEGDYTTCFQSRLGRDPWLQPYTSDIVEKLAKEGKKNVLVFCPAFVADCLETTIEIGVEYMEEFEEFGGEHLQLVEGLNAHPLWASAVKDIILEYV